MPGVGESRADANRRIRREAVREKLEAEGLIQAVIESAQRLSALDKDMDAVAVQRLRAANDARLKLINKYLPDAKDDQNVTLSGSLGLSDLTEDELDRRIEQLNKAPEG